MPASRARSWWARARPGCSARSIWRGPGCGRSCSSRGGRVRGGRRSRPADEHPVRRGRRGHVLGRKADHEHQEPDGAPRAALVRGRRRARGDPLAGEAAHRHRSAGGRGAHDAPPDRGRGRRGALPCAACRRAFRGRRGDGRRRARRAHGRGGADGCAARGAGLRAFGARYVRGRARGGRDACAPAARWCAPPARRAASL